MIERFHGPDVRRFREGDAAQIVRIRCVCGCCDGDGVLAASRCVPMCLNVILLHLKDAMAKGNHD